MEVFLVDSCVQNKQDKQTKFLGQAGKGKVFHLSFFLRQAVALSGETLPLE